MVQVEGSGIAGVHNTGLQLVPSNKAPTMYPAEFIPTAVLCTFPKSGRTNAFPSGDQTVASPFGPASNDVPTTYPSSLIALAFPGSFWRGVIVPSAERIAHSPSSVPITVPDVFIPVAQPSPRTAAFPSVSQAVALSRKVKPSDSSDWPTISPAFSPHMQSSVHFHRCPREPQLIHLATKSRLRSLRQFWNSQQSNQRR
jgi:hypothetical protein